MKTLSIIGCGKLGRTLGLLLVTHHGYRVQDILCRSSQHAQDAVQFIGDGRAISNYPDLKAANTIMLAVNDDQLPAAVATLQTVRAALEAEVIFHCSGSFSHEILQPLKTQNTSLASLHPAKSFSQPEIDFKNFQGTYCTLEGEAKACQELQEKFTLIGAHLLEIKPNLKMLYHIATIFSSNYLVTLLDTSLQLLEKTGISREEGVKLIEPLALGALQQVKKIGPEKALTGPIIRGDSDLVAKQIHLLEQEAKNLAPIYKQLGKLTLELANKEHPMHLEMIEFFRQIFTEV